MPEAFETAADDDGALLLMVDGRAVGKMPKDGFYFSELANATMGGLDAMLEPPDPDTVRFPLLTDEDLRFRQDAARRCTRRPTRRWWLTSPTTAAGIPQSPIGSMRWRSTRTGRPSYTPGRLRT